MPSPLAVETEEVLTFVRAALPQAARVLEIGAGDGRLAKRLAMEGWRVKAVDLDADAAAAAKGRGVDAECADFFRFRAPDPFDALLFTRSFHHLAPLDAAIAHCRTLVRPGGVLVFDEFAHDAVDLETATWFYEMQALLESEGVLAPEKRRHHHHAPAAASEHDAQAHATHSPLERWRERHAHGVPLHGGQEMVDALGAAFALSPVERLPYLYRYLVDRLPQDGAGLAVFERIRAQEAERIAHGRLARVGLRFSARV